MKNGRILKCISLLCLCACLVYAPAGFFGAEVSAAEQPLDFSQGYTVILSEEGALNTLEEIPDEDVPASVVVLEEEGALTIAEEIPDEPIPVKNCSNDGEAEALPMNDVVILEEEGSQDTLEEIPDEPVPAASQNVSSKEQVGFTVPVLVAVIVLLIAVAAGGFYLLIKKRKGIAQK